MTHGATTIEHFQSKDYYNNEISILPFSNTRHDELVKQRWEKLKVQHRLHTSSVVVRVSVGVDPAEVLAAKTVSHRDGLLLLQVPVEHVLSQAGAAALQTGDHVAQLLNSLHLQTSGIGKVDIASHWYLHPSGTYSVDS